jgi:IS5 family transposase
MPGDSQARSRQTATKLQISKSPKKAAERKKARKSIKTKAGVLVREMRRKLSPESLLKHEEILKICEKVLNQKREDKDKIYSLHEPEVGCIAKGKAHKKYEFGSKVSFGVSQKSNVIVSVVNFKGNPNDNKTLDKTLEKQEKLTGVRAKNAYVDRGYKSRRIGETKIQAPSNGVGKTASEKTKLRKSFRRRAGIEPIIGHTKTDFGMGRNYLKGEIGDAINAMLAASAFNFKSWMRNAVEKLFFVLEYLKQMLEQFPKSPKTAPILFNC